VDLGSGEHLPAPGLDHVGAGDEDVAAGRGEEGDSAVRGEDPAADRRRGEPAGGVDQGGGDPGVQELVVLPELGAPGQAQLDQPGFGVCDLEPRPRVEGRRRVHLGEELPVDQGCGHAPLQGSV